MALRASTLKVSSSGGTISLDPSDMLRTFIISDTVSLSNHLYITASFTPSRVTMFELMVKKGVITKGAFNFYFFGESVPQSELDAGGRMVALWDGAAWIVNHISVVGGIVENDPVFVASEAYLFQTGDKDEHDDMRQAQVDIGDPTGFIDSANIVVEYDNSARTITLTHSSGTIYYYWKGERKSLASPWTSSAHADTTDAYYLYSTDGTNFTWSTSVWSFSDVMVSAVVENRVFALREVHGCWPITIHESHHRQFGTYRSTGGGLVVGTYALNTDTDAANDPSFAAVTIHDEDCPTTLSLWSEGTYTHLWFTASGTMNWDTTASHVVYASGSYAYINDYDESLGTYSWAATVGNRYLNYYIIRIPVASDTESQKYRAVVVHPQAAYSSLASAEAEEYINIRLGDFATLSPEYVAVERITYKTSAAFTTTGKVQMVAIALLVGNRSSQTTISGMGAITAENVSWTPYGDLSSTNVQLAIEEAYDYFKPLTGVKSSAVDAGDYVGQISMTDDYVYICVTAGIAGAATWKKYSLTTSP